MDEVAIERLAAAARHAADTLTRQLIARDLSAAEASIADLAGRPDAIRLDIVDNIRTAEAAPVWRIDAPSRSRMRFHPRSWEREPLLILGRFVATLPMLIAALPALPAGWCSLNLGDEGHRPGLAFCESRVDYALVPDAIFLMTGGYAGIAAAFADQRPWTERAPTLFWRGALTGRRAPSNAIDSLPRVRLCRWARTSPHATDIGLTDLLDAVPPEREQLAREDLLRPYVPIDRLDRYRCQLDIDGNSSSWPGLMAKLLSGSPVLKVTSEQGWRQWYYDRLVPWRHYVPVRSDLADLDEQLGRLIADDGLAQAIGAAGRALALSMTVGGEIARAIPTIAAAIRP